MATEPIVFDEDRAIELYNSGQYSYQEVGQMIQDQHGRPIRSETLRTRIMSRVRKRNRKEMADAEPLTPERVDELYDEYKRRSSLAIVADRNRISTRRIREAFQSKPDRYPYPLRHRRRKEPPPRCERCTMALKEVVNDGTHCFECRLVLAYPRAEKEIHSWASFFWSDFGRRFLIAEMPAEQRERRACRECGVRLNDDVLNDGSICFECAARALESDPETIRLIELHFRLCRRNEELGKKNGVSRLIHASAD